MKRQNSNSLKTVSKLSGMFMNTEKCRVQRVSKVSEWLLETKKRISLCLCVFVREMVLSVLRRDVQNGESPQLRELKARKARKARKVESWEPEYIPLFPYFPEVKTSHAMGVPPAIAGMAAGNPEPENFHFSVSVILYMKINILF